MPGRLRQLGLQQRGGLDDVLVKLVHVLECVDVPGMLFATLRYRRVNSD